MAEPNETVSDGMELEDFVKSTLLQIIRGISNADRELAASDINAVISPKSKKRGAGKSRKVRFDVAVTVSRGKEGGGEAGLRVVGIGLGARGKLSAEDSVVSRVSFNVPVWLPHERAPDDDFEEED